MILMGWMGCYQLIKLPYLVDSLMVRIHAQLVQAFWRAKFQKCRCLFKHLFGDNNEILKMLCQFLVFPTTASFNLCMQAALAMC